MRIPMGTEVMPKNSILGHLFDFCSGSEVCDVGGQSTMQIPMGTEIMSKNAILRHLFDFFSGDEVSDIGVMWRLLEETFSNVWQVKILSIRGFSR